jgi:4-carboxymuconolactone decarboxylase
MQMAGIVHASKSWGRPYTQRFPSIKWRALLATATLAGTNANRDDPINPSPRFKRNPMARISLIEPEQHPELEPILAKISSGRRGTIINVYKLLLHSPAISEVWLDLINAVRWKVDLDGRLREIVIIRIGYLNGCSYVVNQHVPLHSAPEGLTQAETDALTDWHATGLFSERERAALAFTDASTREVDIPEPTFDALRRHFSERQIVELTVLIGTYNMHTRMCQALKIDPQT